MNKRELNSRRERRVVHNLAFSISPFEVNHDRGLEILFDQKNPQGIDIRSQGTGRMKNISALKHP